LELKRQSMRRDDDGWLGFG